MKNIFLPICTFLLIILLAANASAFLSVADVDIESPGKSNEVKPNELLTITFEVENEGEDKIEDVEALVYFERSGKKMKDDSGDELEFEFDLDYIKGEKSKSVEFTFNIPFDVEDSQMYDVVVEVTGKNSSDRERYEDIDRSENFEIIKDRHELLFYKHDINPTTIVCNRALTVNYDIRNIGERDEEINLSIVNKLFGINVLESFELEEEYDDDNKWEKTHVFNIPSGIAPGTYGLTINLYYDGGDLHQYNSTNIVVEKCDGTSGSGSSDDGNDGSGTADTNDTSGSGNVDVVYTQPTTATSVPASQPKKDTGIDTTVLLIVAAVIAVLLLIVVIVVLLSRK